MQKQSLKLLAGFILATSVAGQAQTTSAPKATTHKTSAKKKHVPIRKKAQPTVQSQIESLRTSMAAQQSQIQQLQQQLSERDAQMQQTQQQAQAAIQQAQQQSQDAAAAQQAVNAQNSATVSNLQSAVGDLKTTNQTLTETVATNKAAVTKAIEHPDEIHFKGVAISPTGSFIEFASVNRTRATGSDIPTPFSAIPFTAANNGQLSEFELTARQSRLALGATGRIGSAQLSGYYEMDWLGTGVTSNNNQSNSYVIRERQLWGQAAFQSGLTITGGSMWSLATETAHATDNKTEVLPQNIDPNYNVGFVWERQPGLRVSYRFSPMVTVGVSAEGAQTLTPSCTASAGATCATNYVVGQSGTGAGLYNSTTTYAYNLAPDIIAKIALDAKLGHFELFGIERNFRNRVYPNVDNTGKVLSSAGAYNDTQVGGGVGGSARIFLAQKRFNFGLKGMYGDGTSRYATTQLPDLTVRPGGQFALLHNFSVLASAEGNVTKRLSLYSYYGTDYVYRTVFDQGTGQVGYGSHLLATSGCGTEPAPGTTTAGYTPSNPASCAVNTKDVREATAGWWYDFYKGPAGRFRQGFQYSWVERNTYTGLNNITPTAIDNVFETSMRYYLP